MPRFSLSSTIKLSSGYQMPILGLGVFRNSNCITACTAALEHGYRLIDTAQVYQNEAEVGRAVRKSGLKREDVFVVTKIIDPSCEYYSALSTVEESLNKMGFSYIDLYLIHAPTCGKARRLETYKALLEKKAEGKIRSIGVSNYAPKHLEEIREAGYEMPTVNQIELHPFCQQKDIVNYGSEHGIVTQAYCPLVRGQFGNPVLQEVSERVKKDPSQVLVRWSIQRGFVPLPKSSKPERVISNADVFDFELSQDDMAKLDSLDCGKEGAVSWNPIDAD